MEPPSALLRAARVALDISQSELANRCGLSKRTVYNVEQGQGTLDTIHRIRKTLEGEGIKFMLNEDDPAYWPGFRVDPSIL
ncbi:helix-turn-helix domain-containing protein [Phyllobacterium sp. SYP-B3895]|uniref:helix-turn-helix domain-containing protein n=1 Tax=Phyllobacterium sp. SYP-B3895 TaxID=2663240 RepID=UPI00351A2475